ncbi:MAG TPA: IS630 family transposase [Methylocella sp.]|jgi:transposase|nr:IS630 family transposase [Methylocella sp.]
MIRGGFLSPRQRAELIGLLRDGRTEQRLARRANAMLLLDDGWSCERAAAALYLDDDTIRGWRKTYDADGVEGLRRFEAGGSAGLLSQAQEEELVVYVSQALPRSTREVGVFIEQVFGVVYDSRSGLIALMRRLGLEYRKPKAIGRRLDALKQQAFIDAYEKLLNSLAPDEATLFVDAVHPTYATRSVGCWAPAGEALAITQTSGRERLNIHGALNLETGKTAMIDVECVDAVSTIRLLQAIEAMYPRMARIHLFLDNARYHHAVLVQEWLAQPGRRVRLRFIPSYCPHLNPIERLWGVMHKHLTHNKSWRDFRQFADAILWFLREKVPRRWVDFRDSVTDNFRVINPKLFRVMA